MTVFQPIINFCRTPHKLLQVDAESFYARSARITVPVLSKW